MNKLIIPRSLSATARAHLFSDYGEHFLFFLCTISEESENLTFHAKDVVLINDNDLVVSEDFEIEISLSVLIEVMNRANKEGLALVEGHNHLSSFWRGFSYTDRKGFSEFVPYVLSTLGRPYGATVWDKRGVAAICWKTDPAKPTKMEVKIAADQALSVKRGGERQRI